MKPKEKHCKYCHDTGICQTCNGAGCSDCLYTGYCSRCTPAGNLIITTADEKTVYYIMDLK